MSTLARSSALAGWCRGVLRCESGKASGEMAGHQHRRDFGAGFILSQTEMGAHNRCHILFLVRGGRAVRRSGSNWQHVLGRAHHQDKIQRKSVNFVAKLQLKATSYSTSLTRNSPTGVRTLQLGMETATFVSNLEHRCCRLLYICCSWTPSGAGAAKT